MENLPANVDMISRLNTTGSALRGGLAFPMIAAKEVAEFLAERLMRKDFSGTSVKDLLGQRGISMDEAATVIGKRISTDPDRSMCNFPMKIQKRRFSAWDSATTWQGSSSK
jgi:hypothetical protein